MPQQTFTEALTEFLDARDNLAHWNQWNTQGIALAHADRLTKAGEKLNAMVQPKYDHGWDWPSKEAMLIGAGVDCSTETNSEPKPVMQYYYKTTDCEARNNADKSCTCWHDEGTGLHKAERFSLHHPFLKWREKPAQADDAEVRIEEPVSDSYTMLLERSERQPSYGPITHTVMLPRELPEMTEEEAREVGSVCINDFGDGMATCKVISLHDVRQIYKRIVEKFGV